MKWLLIVIGLLAIDSLKSQVYVKPGGEGDGSSWEQAMGNIRRALMKGLAEVRVGVGTYRLDGELQVQAGQLLTGGWFPEANARVGDAAEKTILIAAERLRVATVGGTMQGFTVSMGTVVDDKGGGVYITSSGCVENCIIRENLSGSYYPKVGDVLCNDGSFLTLEQIDALNAGQVCGIVFWVNPDKEASEGRRGWVMGLQMGLKAWCNSQKEHIETFVFESTRQALKDTMGYGHAQAVIDQGKQDYYPAVGFCHDLSAGGKKWYVPAFGQLNVLFSELGVIKPALAKLSDFVGGGGFASIVYDKTYISSSETESEGYVWCMVLSDESMICGTQAYIDNAYILPITSF